MSVPRCTSICSVSALFESRGTAVSWPKGTVLYSSWTSDVLVNYTFDNGFHYFELLTACRDHGLISWTYWANTAVLTTSTQSIFLCWYVSHPKCILLVIDFQNERLGHFQEAGYPRIVVVDDHYQKNWNFFISHTKLEVIVLYARTEMRMWDVSTTLW